MKKIILLSAFLCSGCGPDLTERICTVNQIVADSNIQHDVQDTIVRIFVPKQNKMLRAFVPKHELANKPLPYPCEYTAKEKPRSASDSIGRVRME